MGHYAGLKPVFNLLNFKNWNDSSVFSVLIDLCSFPGPHVKKKKIQIWCHGVCCGCERRRDFGTRWPTNLAYLVSSRLVKGSSL